MWECVAVSVYTHAFAQYHSVCRWQASSFRSLVACLSCRCECWVKHKLLCMNCSSSLAPTELELETSHTFCYHSYEFAQTGWVWKCPEVKLCSFRSIFVIHCDFLVAIKHIGECCYRKMINNRMVWCSQTWSTVTEVNTLKLILNYFIPLIPQRFANKCIITYIWFINEKHLMLFNCLYSSCCWYCGTSMNSSWHLHCSCSFTTPPPQLKRQKNAACTKISVLRTFL